MRHKPKKYLGQNFLFDRNIQQKIIAACNFKNDDLVLEIGAGRGEFTRLIAPRVSHLYAVELDQALAEPLQRDFRNSSNVEIIEGDILKLDLFRRFSGHSRKLKIFGNIPYYITTPIIAHLLKFRSCIAAIYLTVQKEVACRITAVSGSKVYGALSCFAQYYTEPQILFCIKKGSFFPVPKVDSCFIRLSPKKIAPLTLKEERRFFRIVRAAFNQRRKTLRNSLRSVVAEKKLGAKAGDRAERLTLEDFLNLART